MRQLLRTLSSLAGSAHPRIAIHIFAIKLRSLGAAFIYKDADFFAIRRAGRELGPAAVAEDGTEWFVNHGFGPSLAPNRG